MTQILIELRTFVCFTLIGLQLQLCFGNQDNCGKRWKGFIPKILNNVKEFHSVKFDCVPFSNCSGTTCSGSGFKKDFNFSVNIEHCSQPFKIGLQINVPSVVQKYMELKNNEMKKILDRYLLPAKHEIDFEVKPVITKNSKNLTLKVHVTGTVYLFDLIPLPLANYSAGSRVTFPVDEKICVEKSASSVQPSKSKNVVLVPESILTTQASKKITTPAKAVEASKATKKLSTPPQTTKTVTARLKTPAAVQATTQASKKITTPTKAVETARATKKLSATPQASKIVPVRLKTPAAVQSTTKLVTIPKIALTSQVTKKTAIQVTKTLITTLKAVERTQIPVKVEVAAPHTWNKVTTSHKAFLKSNTPKKSNPEETQTLKMVNTLHKALTKTPLPKRTTTTLKVVVATHARKEVATTVTPVATNQASSRVSAKPDANTDMTTGTDETEKNGKGQRESEKEGGGRSHFPILFLVAIVAVFLGYGLYHNRQKIVAIIVEGKNSNGERRPNSREYKSLSMTVSEAMPSMRKFVA